MKIFLLIRESPCQRYCANVLFQKKIISDVIVEEGSSTGGRSFLKRISAKGSLLLRPQNLFWSCWNYCHEAWYYGQKDKYEHKILGTQYGSFDRGLNVIRTSDINSDFIQRYFKENLPDLVFVFGTRIIKPWVFDVSKAPVINMHWGWSPDFRGEGIVTALAFRGIDGLGVTVHRLTSVPDGGEIIRQERPAVDSSDNFYSIGLKLAVIGTRIFVEVFSEFLGSKTLKGVPQNLNEGHFYSVKFMRENPRLKFQAWKNLKIRIRIKDNENGKNP